MQGKSKATKLVAHRGGAALHAENSSSAFVHAANLSIDAIECDVHLSSDDEVAVIHDATLERTVGRSGRVREWTADELKLMPLLGTAGEGVPLLRELVALLEPTDKTLSLEIKSDVDNVVYAGMAEKALDILSLGGMRARTIVHSFDFDFLRGFSALAPDVQLAANVEEETFERFHSLDAILDAIIEIDADILNIDHRLLDAAGLQKAWDRGLQVTVWTVNTDEDLALWLARGVDYITTDRPDVALRLRAA